jgi:hypothetical protein
MSLFICILIPVITGLLTSILGYILGKQESKKDVLVHQKSIDLYKKNIEDLKVENNLLITKENELKDANARLEATLFSLNKEEKNLTYKSAEFDFETKIADLEKRFVASTIANENMLKNKIVSLELSLQETKKNEQKLKEYIEMLESRLK